MSSKHTSLPAEEVARRLQLDLKNRSLAAFLAWLVPGAGHFYQGRTAKGWLFFICIVSTFLFGFWLGNGKVAYATPITAAELRQMHPGSNFLQIRFKQALDRWQFLCQAGIGSVALPAMVERTRYLNGRGPITGEELHWFHPPRDRAESFPDGAGNQVTQPNELGKWTYKLGHWFELGSIYCVIAGLLNILAVYDAYAGPLLPAQPDKGDGNRESSSEGLPNSKEANSKGGKT